MSDATIACTLSAGAFKERMSAIANLNRDALRSHDRGDLTLVLTYAPDAGARVRDMVRKEGECCAFLEFDLREESDAVRLRITAPEEARVAADALFDDFVRTAAETSACQCC